MEIAVHGRHVPLPDAVRQHAAEKAEHLSKYLQGVERAEVLFSDGKKGHFPVPVTCELVMEAKGRVVRTVGVGATPEGALELAADKAAHRLRKTKDRLVSRSRPRHRTAKETSGTLPEEPAES